MANMGNKSKDKSALFRDLDDSQRVAVTGIVRKLTDGHKLTKGDCGLLGDDPSISQADLLRLLSVDLAEVIAITKKGKFPAKSGRSDRQTSYYNLGEVLQALWSSATSVDNDLETQKLREQVKKLEIENKVSEGEFISKEKAKERNTTLLRALRNMITYGLKRAAPMLCGVANAQEAERIMRISHEDAFRVLEESAEKKTWREE